jgi:hypothetical protein
VVRLRCRAPPRGVRTVIWQWVSVGLIEGVRCLGILVCSFCPSPLLAKQRLVISNVPRAICFVCSREASSTHYRNCIRIISSPTKSTTAIPVPHNRLQFTNNSTLHVTSRQRQTQIHHLGSFIRPQHLARLNVLVPYLKLPCPPKRHMTLGDLQSTYSHDLRPSQDDRASLPIGLILRRIASLACMEGDVEVCMEAHVTLFPVRLGLVRC